MAQSKSDDGKTYMTDIPILEYYKLTSDIQLAAMCYVFKGKPEEVFCPKLKGPVTWSKEKIGGICGVLFDHCEYKPLITPGECKNLLNNQK